MTIFFCADTHFCHNAIRAYTNRPFQTYWEMNEALIANWNSVVKEEDTVYHLGDIGIGKKWEITKCFHELKGKIHWIIGNHDKRALKWYDLTKRFESISEYKEIDIPDDEIKFRGNRYCKTVLFHYPIASWNGMHHGSFMLHGHTHCSFATTNNKILDVGVDAWNYTPVSFEEVKKFMETRAFVAVDGNGRKGVYKQDLRKMIGEK